MGCIKQTRNTDRERGTRLPHQPAARRSQVWWKRALREEGSAFKGAETLGPSDPLMTLHRLSEPAATYGWSKVNTGSGMLRAHQGPSHNKLNKM